ncbi:MAG: AAA-associated domain-containing protein [Candidatus Micrarchaeota archaeon]|nr:AAA-associated domain-containing protein [Candidatus Micrarchaeota archaeon]MDE1823704.1 AAA-associated domain-containing protein [Candidatus Micrarchaeota archaeon]MDE1849178.1 AAA-associated domain-containing protein [Candidatus Micrarchaeota archaeon]
MATLFPLGPGIGRIRGIVGLIKQNNGEISISELAQEAGEDIDDLLPMIEACKLLGFAVVDSSTIKLTKEGNSLTVSNASRMIREKLPAIEPFKSTVAILSKNYATSRELFDLLHAKGILLHGDKTTNNEQLKKMLLRWGVRSKLIEYDANKDEWRLR